MLTVEKSAVVTVTACELGAGSALEQALLSEGKIRRLPSGQYEIFSREAQSGSGELACAGDFVKLDGGGFPYPNGRDFFLPRHTPLGGSEYRQIPQKCRAWRLGEPPCPEIDWLLETKRLSVDPDSFEKYYSAFLWGAELSADRNAVILFYSITPGADGGFEKISFNFVAKEEFDRSYRILPPEETY